MSKELKAIIVEDETASRETLAGYIEKYCNNVKVVAKTDGVKTGIAAIHKHHPDIVFLDIEMPFGNGFDLLEQVGEINFETVFVTAFSNYAIKALNSSASYYILKPVDIDELVEAVDKIRISLEEKQGMIHTKILLENIQIENKQLQKVVLPTLEGFEVVRVQEIIRCQANDNFTDFHLTDGSKKVICRTLKFYEEALGEMDFVRVHKSHLVNVQHIKKYKKGKGGQLEMSDQSIVDVSSTKKENLLKIFK